MSSDINTRDTLLIDEVEPLTTLITIQNGREVLVSAVDNGESNETAQNALNVFGAWRDLDWNETASALNRIRHDSAPTPPHDE